MSGTTDDTLDQEMEALCGRHGVPRYTDNVHQVEAFYARLGFHRYTDNGQTLCRFLGGPCDRNSTCLALQELVVYAQKKFSGRRNTKALILGMPILWEKARVFVEINGESFPSTRYPNNLNVELDRKIRGFQEQIVSFLLMLEREIERENTKQGQ